MTSLKTEKTESRINVPILILFLLSLVLNGYLLYNWYQNNYSDGKSLKELNAELTEVVSMTEFSLDSIQAQYTILENQYQNIMNEFETIQVERDAALAEVGAKKVRIRQLINQIGSNPRVVVALKTEIEDLKSQLVNKKVELDGVVQEKEKFRLESESTVVQVETLIKENEKAEEKNIELENKIRNVKFQIDDLKVIPLRNRRGKFEETQKTNKIDHIEISFSIVESDLIEFGEKEIVLRILGTNGEVLGADNNTLLDSDKLISMSEAINFQGSTEKIKFKFEQEEAFKKGGHTAEIWHNGERLVRTQFNLR
jgi:hypothetical protein